MPRMFRLFLILGVLGTSIAYPAADVDGKNVLHPDVGLTVLELIEKYGYPLEVHENIETEDGYLVDMHRIPHGKTNADEANKPVVLLMHCLLCSSAVWVNAGPEHSLAFLLADMGYDVWMGNARGNTWSKKHTVYDPDNDSEFWKFSWHQIGVYDLTAKIDHILETTGVEKIFYVGHSQGTTSFFVMASERPEYNEKIRLMVALAPVAYMSNLNNDFLQLLSQYHDSIEWILEFIGMYEFLPDVGLFKLLGQACEDDSPFEEICENILFLITGWDSEKINEEQLPVILSSLPAGASTKQFIHYAQGIKSAHFRRYDYGLVTNLVEYGSVTPPDYNMGNIVAPVSLFYSTNDGLAAVVDVEQLYSELSNGVYIYLMPDEKWNHMDFLYSHDIVDELYTRMFDLMSSY